MNNTLWHFFHCTLFFQAFRDFLANRDSGLARHRSFILWISFCDIKIPNGKKQYSTLLAAVSFTEVGVSLSMKQRLFQKLKSNKTWLNE